MFTLLEKPFHLPKLWFSFYYLKLNFYKILKCSEYTEIPSKDTYFSHGPGCELCGQCGSH